MWVKALPNEEQTSKQYVVPAADSACSCQYAFQLLRPQAAKTDSIDRPLCGTRDDQQGTELTYLLIFLPKVMK